MPTLSDLAALSPHEHEALCRRCGMSCHFAIPVNGLAVVIDALRCKFLARDEAGKFGCSVYERRFAVAPWCHTAESALTGGFLAQDCPYARGVPGYRGKVRLSPALLRKVLPAVRAEVARAGAPIGADPDAVAEFLGEGTGASWQYGVSADGSRYVFTPARGRREAAVHRGAGAGNRAGREESSDCGYAGGRDAGQPGRSSDPGAEQSGGTELRPPVDEVTRSVVVGWRLCARRQTVQKSTPVRAFARPAHEPARRAPTVRP